MPKSTLKTKRTGKREESLDILRGIAVLLMILAHTIAFIHTQESTLLNTFQNLGDTVCFVIFLLVSGASTYFAYINITNRQWESKKRNLLKRSLNLLFGYYLVAIISSLKDFPLPPSTVWLENVFRILIFVKVPGYTEFLIPFILYSFLIIIFRDSIRKLITNKATTIITGVLTYTLGYFIYKIAITSPLIYYKSLIAGQPDWYRFPLLQYFWVFLTGLLLGQFLKRRNTQIKKIKFLFKIASIFTFFLSFSILIAPISKIPYSDSFQRWPPSISFISIGLALAFIILALVKIKIKSTFLQYVKDLLTFCGQRAFGIFIYHIIILQLENKFLHIKFSTTFEVIAAFILLTIVCSFIAWILPQVKMRLNQKISIYFNFKVSTKKTKRKKSPNLYKEKYFILAISILSISLICVFFLVKNLTKPTIPAQSQISDKNNENQQEVRGVFTDENVEPQLFGQINRKWILKGTKEFRQYSTLVYTVEITEIDNLDTAPKYQVLNSPNTGAMEKVSNGKYEIELDSDKFDTGTYQIQSTTLIEGKEFITEELTFYISYPFYVIWTMDWEGGDTINEELDNIVKFTQKHYDLPITHFFNPRIYIANSISQDRVDYLTNWILNRKYNGDEIGLHLHMHYEIVKTANVEVRTEPQWTDYLDTGHDVPFSEYTYDESVKILNWAKNEFRDKGLGTPKSFRAGGWFADLDTLQALEDTGFLIDSSGRDYYIWGNNHIKGYWNLKPTVQPYPPSKSNQNSPTPYPVFSLWEFPNNGADSWFYKSSDLIKRFKDNFKEEILNEYKVVTYLTHPHLFSIDLEQLDPTYEYIDQYHIEDDTGPIVYTTLEKSYNDINVKE